MYIVPSCWMRGIRSEEAVGDDCPLIVALGYDEDIVCAKNSSEAQTLGEAIVYAVSLIAGQ